MKQKKLIIFIPSIEEGGVEKNLFIISQYFSKKIKETSIITIDKKKIKIKKNKIKIISTKKDWSKRSRFFKYIICIFLLINTIKKNNEIIVLSFQANLYAILLCKMFNIKIIARANSSPSGWANNLIKKTIFKLILKLSSFVVVNSKELKNEFKRKFNIKSTLIYNPLNVEEIKKKFKEKNNLNFFNNQKQLKIISIGRFTKQKDQITLLKAASLLKLKINFKILLLGQGIEKSNLRKYILENKLSKNVVISKYLNNPFPLIKKSDLFVLTSIYEGLPNVLLEAIALNKIAISTNCPTGPKEILLNGKGGILFKVGNYIELAQKIINFSKNKKIYKKKIFIAKKSLNRFNYDLNLNKYLKLYKSLN